MAQRVTLAESFSLQCMHFFCRVHDFFSTFSRFELFSGVDCEVPMWPVQRYFRFKVKLFRQWPYQTNAQDFN